MNAVLIPKPKIVLLDFSGTIAMKAFMSYSGESKEFLKKYIRPFIEECYPKKKELRLAFNFMKLHEKHDRDKSPKLAENNAPRDKRAESIIKWVLYKIDKDSKAYSIPAISLFQLHMIEWGYEKDLLKTPIYEDVFEILTHWTQNDNITIYVTLASSRFSELVMSKTTVGDLRPFFKANVSLMEFKDGRLTKTFDKVLTTFKVEANSVLFLTRISEDARQAKELGIQCVLVVRSDFEPHLTSKIAEAKKLKQQAKKGDTASIRSYRSSSRSTSSIKIAQTVVSTTSTIGESSSTDDASSLEGLTTASTIDPADLLDFPVALKLKDINFK